MAGYRFFAHMELNGGWGDEERARWKGVVVGGFGGRGEETHTAE
jgi:hypothetical protein